MAKQAAKTAKKMTASKAVKAVKKTAQKIVKAAKAEVKAAKRLLTSGMSKKASGSKPATRKPTAAKKSTAKAAPKSSQKKTAAATSPKHVSKASQRVGAKSGLKSAPSRSTASARAAASHSRNRSSSLMPVKEKAIDSQKGKAPASKQTPAIQETRGGRGVVASVKATGPVAMQRGVSALAADTVEASPLKRVKPKLKGADVKKLRELLQHERSRIIEEMRILDDRSLTMNLEEGANQQPGFSLQLADSASENMQVETDLGIRSIEAEQLLQIDDALRALATGDYGICQRCNQPITVERLFARPNAKYCINCLKLLESGKA